MIEERVVFGYEGVLTIATPVLVFGKGEPRLAITCSVHGDEHVGLLIATRLKTHLEALEESLQGSVAIMLAANPAAQFVRTRVSPQDLKDLNRAGKGRLGSYTERVARTLFQYLQKFDFVVNIHEFEMRTPVTSVYMNTGARDVRRRMIEGIRAFSPEIVWVIEYGKPSDVQYAATLDAALAQAGIPNFPIETTQMAFITEEEVNRVVKGFLQLMGYLGILKAVEQSEALLQPYIRHEFTSDIAGLWEPELTPRRKINRGERIGWIYRLPTLHREPVVSPVDGELLQVRLRQLVGTGTSLFSVGEKVSIPEE